MMPQYFGVQIAGFDITPQRLAMVIFMIYILDSSKQPDFIDIVKHSTVTPYIFIYMVVLTYTTILRVNINSFMYSFIEFICFYFVIYIIKDVLGVKNFLKLLLRLIFVLVVLGIIEFVIQRSLFSYLVTLPGLYTGRFIRSGAYRIMGPNNHSLAYGLLLVSVAPIACIDIENDEVNILENIVLLIMIALNVVLTGSRSTLAVFGLEMIILLLLSPSLNKRKTIFFLLTIGSTILFVLIIARNTILSQYVFRQITSIIDELVGTSFSVSFGADVARLTDSSNYRELLPKIFLLDWLNPLLGKGSGYRMSVEIDGFVIRSIDNFYVAQYIRFAYPGLIVYIMIIISTGLRMVKYIATNRSGIVICLFIASTCYFINLWWLDTLQTIKYVYILYAVFYAMSFIKRDRSLGIKSQYIR